MINKKKFGPYIRKVRIDQGISQRYLAKKIGVAASYLNAPINQIFKPTMTITKGNAVTQMTVQPEFFHAAGHLHGAAIFKLLDDSAWAAAQSVEMDFMVVTVSFTTYFLRPVNQGELTASASIVSKTKSNIVVSGTILDENNKCIANGTGSFSISNFPVKDVFKSKIQ